MDDIFISDGNAVLSRIVFGARVSDMTAILGICAGKEDRLPLYIITDSNTDRYADVLAHAAGVMHNVEVCGQYRIDAAEESKTMSSVLSMVSWLLESGADRNAFLLAVGGGITTDMAGFAASVFKRGIRFAYMPTTLLAQVDAAIGGKTGVNYDSYKNMIGVIRQPEFTFICPEVLETLPSRDFLSGAAELVKTFLIQDGGNYAGSIAFLSELGEARDRTAFLKENAARLSELVHAAAAVKAGIVSRDQFESGERRKLNLGHTFAHAIEKNARMAGDDISHGEAVSMGILMAATLSCRTGLAEVGVDNALRNDFMKAGLAADCPYTAASLAEAMAKDKKAENGKIHFVLLSRPGDVRIVDMTAADAVGILNE